MLRFLLSCVLLLLHSLAASVEQEPDTGLQLVPSLPAGSAPDVLLVTLLDGHVIALDHTNGRVLWTYDTGAPLVSAKQTAEPSQGMNVFPGADGGLYAYNGMKHLNPGLERLPISLPELVEAAPSLTADGSLILGRRESKVFLLDKRTGRSISTLSNTADALEDHSGSLGLSVGVGREHLLLLGRQDYVVRSMRVDSKAETWNATFSRLYMMSSDTASIKDFLQHGAAPRLEGAHRPNDLPHLVVGSDNSLRAYDSKTMLRKWYIAFDTPPISAYRQDGQGGNYLDPEQAGGPWPRASTGLLPHGNPLLPSHKIKGKLAGGTTVLVGALKGSLYALPADHLMLATDGDEGLPGSNGAVVWPSRVGSMPMDITPADTGAGLCDAGGQGAAAGPGGAAVPGRPSLPLLPGPAAIGAGGSNDEGRGSDAAPAPAPTIGGAAAAGCGDALGSCNGSLALVDDASSDAHSLVPLEPSDTGLMDELASLTCPQPPLGIHSITVQQAQTVAWLPDTVPSSKTPQEDAAPRWSSLRLLLTSLVALLLLPLLLGWRAYYVSSSNNNSSKALAVQAMPLGPPVPGSGLSSDPAGSPSRPSKKGRSKNKSKKQAVADATGTTSNSTPTNSTPDGFSSDNTADSISNSYNDIQQLQAAAANLSGSMQPSKAPSAAPSPSASPVPPGLLGDGLGDPGATSPVPAGVSDGGGPGMLSSRSYVDEDGAVVIGRLRVGPGILGYGSAGTIVYEGCLDSRPVAVKRLLRQFYNLARKEIQVLVVSDEHPNVVRCFAMEEDREFVYLALERCKHSLSDTLGSREGQEAMQDPVTGSPTPWCMAVLADIAAGLAALHARQIVHRDLKPHNVLLTEAGRAKLSDMGLSKQLVSEQSSFESHGSGGSSGWQAPEQLIAKDGGAVRQSRAVDVFSLGCIMFYCLTGGKHPFGEHYERDTNILRGHSSLTPLQRWPEALNLVSAMLAKSPGQRPSMAAVLGHPFWWSDEQRLQFLVDVSDRVENEDREPDPSLLNALESYTCAAVGPNWGALLDAELIANLGKYRRYDYTCLRDLLRVVRNKRNHFREMPDSLQQLLGPVPDGYYRYFSSRFPMLLLGVFFFALRQLDGDPNLAKYWAGGEHQFMAFNKPWEAMAAAAATRGSSKATRSGSRRNSSSGLSRMSPSPLPPCGPPGTPPPPPRTAAVAGAGAGVAVVAAAAAVAAAAVSPDSSSRSGVISYSRVAAAPVPAPAAAAAAGREPAVSNGGGSTAGSADGPPVVGYVVAEGEEVLYKPNFPVRPGKQHCEFYIKTGHCKYKGECVFDHPPEYVVPLTEQGLPFRPDQPVCTFYQKTQQCKYGPSCKFHHPKLIPIYAGSAIQQ